MLLPDVPEIIPCNRHHAISLLFANDPDLLNFFFTPNRQQLTWGSARRTMRWAVNCLDSQQATLVRIALGIWLERGRCSFVEAYRGLGVSGFETFLRALELLSSTGGCSCPSCGQRNVVWTNDHRLGVEYF